MITKKHILYAGIAASLTLGATNHANAKVVNTPGSPGWDGNHLVDDTFQGTIFDSSDTDLQVTLRACETQRNLCDPLPELTGSKDGAHGQKLAMGGKRIEVDVDIKVKVESS
tara:strand:- start:13 stop:348 length:336 start_codon:yes stop_codon:yes gene_type:complete